MKTEDVLAMRTDPNNTDNTNNTYILRLVNLSDKDNTSLNMRYFFSSPYCISSLSATYLTGNKVKQVIYVDEDDPPTISLPSKQIRTFVITVELDTTNCKNDSCGKKGTCVELPCAYSCSCAFQYHFDHTTKSCEPNEGGLFPGQLSKLFQQLPLVILSYLSFVCAYSIRSEMKKIAGEIGTSPIVIGSSSLFRSSSSSSRSSSSGSINSPRSTGRVANLRQKISRFMQANKQILERVFFPTVLRNRHQD